MKTIYAEILEKKALEQFENACSHSDFVKGALMADAHTGYSMPIGGVVGLKNTVVPAWVGYDIGCGVCAVETGLYREEVNIFKESIFSEIYKKVPMGSRYNDNPTSHNLNFKGTKLPQIARREIGYQLGTLGGGNHFIEIAYDENSKVWVIIHSGSRGVGWKTADAYMGFDEEEKGFLIDSAIGSQYMKDMYFYLEFALLNRKIMLRKIQDSMSMVMKRKIEFNWDSVVNRNHNHASVEHGMVIHRKGATHAEKGMFGIIPGNMKDGSFIVQGLGNPDSLWSSSHGAGRVLSRSKAKNKLSVDVFKSQMEGIKGKVCLETLDESPLAYKDIFDVIQSQVNKGLIVVEKHLKPIINCKA